LQKGDVIKKWFSFTNAHVQISGMLLRNAMAAVAVKMIYSASSVAICTE
jgi:hypothetical protein